MYSVHKFELHMYTCTCILYHEHKEMAEEIHVYMYAYNNVSDFWHMHV